MLKSAILLTTAIGSILSISSIANAAGKSNNLITQPNSVHHFSSNLIAKGKKAQIDRQDPAISRDLPGISQAISKHYKEWNEKLAPSGNAWSGACSFIEIKSLKLTSLSELEAEVEVKTESQSYSLLGLNVKPRQWVYKKYEDSLNQKQTRKISLKKYDGKWKVSTVS
jgi:hypothetical protein